MPTALELTREQWKLYTKSSRRRSALAAMTPDQQLVREELLRRAREAAAFLKKHFGARRVVLFGSLAHAAWFHPNSDVDLAVEGLSGDAYWGAWRMLEEQIPDRSIDLVEIETAGESLQNAIRRSGIDL